MKTRAYRCDPFFKAMAQQRLALTFNDVLTKFRYADFLPREADLSASLTKRLKLKIPIVSSCMDTVTEYEMAIAMALEGGIGFIHKALSPEQQGKMVARVKYYLNGFIDNPIVISENDSIEDVQAMRQEKGYAFDSFPVTGKNGKIIGLVSTDDFRFGKDKKKISEIMSRDLISAPSGTKPEKAYELMVKHRKKILPLFDAKKNFKGIYTLADVERLLNGDQNKYALDKDGRLLAGAAVGVGPDLPERMEALNKSKVDVIVIDTAHGDSKGVIEAIKYCKKKYPHIDVIAGNISNGEAAKRLAAAGADGVRVGQGGGSICTTRKISGAGHPQLSAIYDCASALRGTDVTVIGDGGIETSGDMVLALAAGAHTIMLGRMLAGTKESPGIVVQKDGKSIKMYRGMGSYEAMRDNAASRERYGQAGMKADKLVPEGVTGYVDYRGTVSEALVQYLGGIRAGLGYNGSRNIQTLHAEADFYLITNSGQKESHVHGIDHVIPAPNYSGGGR